MLKEQKGYIRPIFPYEEVLKGYNYKTIAGFEIYKVLLTYPYNSIINIIIIRIIIRQGPVKNDKTKTSFQISTILPNNPCSNKYPIGTTLNIVI